MTKDDYNKLMDDFHKSGGLVDAPKPKPGDAPPASASPMSDNPVATAGEYAKHAVMGAGKEVMREANPHGGLLGAMGLDKPIRDWANAPSDYPTTEWAGGEGAKLAPYAMFGEEIAADRGLGWLANRAFQGGVGGAAANPKDPVKGALTGAGGGVLGGGIGRIMGSGRETLGSALGAAEIAGHLTGHSLPWWGFWRLLHPLTHMAHHAHGLPSALVGNLAEKGARELGYDDGPDQTNQEQ